MLKKSKATIILVIALGGIAVIFYLIILANKKAGKNSSFVSTVHAPATTQSKTPATTQSKNSSTTSLNSGDKTQTLIKPDGNINNIVSNIINNTETENQLITQDETDAQAASDDSQDLNNFSQSYDFN